mgnify:CR=1 FL=1|tara:strand:+ start:3775 stop:4761 length:987 start_codon:yes stop_codon:yes gene_type:complete
MKRKVVLARNEYADFINAQNNRTNVYTTVYDFQHFSEKAKIESSVIIDRIFLDFDAHEDELELAWRDVKVVMNMVINNNWLHTLFFSGRGFHLFLFGKRTNNMRNVQTFFREVKENLSIKVGRKNTLDERVGQTTRLRRVPNTVNMSSSDENGNPYYCVPLTVDDLSLNLEQILSIAKKPRHIPFKKGGENEVLFPEAPPMEALGGAVSVPETVGKLPMLPCLHNAVMTENPSHMSRAYLVSWYRDLISGYRDLTTGQEKMKVLELVIEELERVFAESDSVWLDWDKNETKKHARFTVFNNYNTPHCDKLISDGYCVGKCWRYHNVDN